MHGGLAHQRGGKQEGGGVEEQHIASLRSTGEAGGKESGGNDFGGEGDVGSMHGSCGGGIDDCFGGTGIDQWRGHVGIRSCWWGIASREPAVGSSKLEESNLWEVGVHQEIREAGEGYWEELYHHKFVDNLRDEHCD